MTTQTSDQPSSRASTIAERLETIRAEIAQICERADRDPAGVRLIAVSKTHPSETIREALAAGQIDFGENRVQEGLAKLDELADTDEGADARIHLIGHLQRNKARFAGRFASVQSIDSLRLAEAVSRQLDAPPNPPLNALLEVNVAGEASKHGFDPTELESAFAQISALPQLRIRGLMTIAPLAADAEQVRPVFRALREMRDALGLPELSMGMSNDYPVAIEEGATIVRIGRAVFGERKV